jgi:P27 family predicted phage terminase small subunit
MGTRGPAPTPTALRLLEGNPSKHPINRQEPQPRARAPKLPDHLDEAAKREWKRLIPILRRMRVLTEADGIALAGLCQAYSTMAQTQTKVNKTGLLLVREGQIRATPLLKIIHECSDRINILCREFGLTPAARSRLQMNSTQNPSGGDDILDF